MALKPIQRYAFRVVPEGTHGWSIYFPDLPGCSTDVLNLDDIGARAEEVLELWLESEKRRGHPIPPAYDAAQDDWWPRGTKVTDGEGNPIVGVPDVAKLLGVSERRVHAIARDRGVGRKFGNYLVFSPEEIDLLRPGQPGRPRKHSPEQAAAAD